MKIRTDSWVIGGAYLVCAVLFFVVISKCAIYFAAQGVALPGYSRVAFAIGPLGWLLLTLATGFMVVLKDLLFPRRVLNIAFCIILIVMVFFVAIAMIIPTIEITE